ncbi:MFS transporter [uncultured Limosilactobacillus sp.]|uniref:MDR family MFS transporter n=1 Tax=uncultured Limosilactobacillus sp. TaxID=2837629 RepID=UPI0025F0FE50|nr:MFS transporter [uncultured Limosilactobacillus sp.]
MHKEFKLHWLLIGELCGSFGNSFIWPLTTVYMHNQLHQPLTISGIVLMIYSFANIGGSILAGKLFDRYQPRLLMLTGLLGATIVMGCLVISNDWPAYPLLLTIFGFFNGWLITLLNSFATQVATDNSRLVFNMVYLTNNLGVVFGTMVAGPLYQLAGNSVAPLFAVSIVMYLAYCIVVRFTFNIDHRQPSAAVNDRSKTAISTRTGYLPLNITLLMMTMTIMWLAYTQWSSNLSVYLTHLGISLSLYSLLWTINGILIVIFQLVISWLTKHVTNDYLFVVVGVSSCLLSFVILTHAMSYPAFVLGMAFLTLGESTAFPTIPAIVSRLASPAVQGKYQGLLNSAISLGKAVGPLLGGIIIELTSYQFLFLFCITIIALAEIMVIIVQRLH